VGQSSIVVLKLGSSVLPDATHFPAVVHEIYRQVRVGRRVVAVVSAVGGATDRMLADSRAVSESPDPHELAELLGFGERESALLLGLALERAGIPATRLGPEDFGLVARGAPLDAEPQSLDAGLLRAALDAHAVVVVPGFIACDSQGRSVLLGRGGSDLSALFIADALGADCRLVKDVDGIYERDPASAGALPRRFESIGWRDALAVAGRLVQPKAIAFAEARGLAFEVAAIGAPHATRVGPGPSRLLPPGPPPQRLRVALFGAGTVGYGVYQLLAAQPERFEVVGVAVRDLGKLRPADLPRALLTDDPWALLARPADLVVELLGGEEPAAALMARALEAGRDVVTANKPVVAEHGALLEEHAARHGRRFAYSASVGGSLPAVELARAAGAGGRVRALEGVLNGTCNYILDRVAAGAPFAEALAEAQRLGYAEADPAQDLSGTDAASKLRILARAAFGAELGQDAVRTSGIDGLDATAIKDDAARGHATRLVAGCRIAGNRLDCEVAPRRLPASATLSQVRGEWNLLRIELENGEPIVARGKGAGRWPTAEAVFADIMDAWRDRATRAAAAPAVALPAARRAVA
jgi:homoserine dehydrogenase